MSPKKTHLTQLLGGSLVLLAVSGVMFWLLASPPAQLPSVAGPQAYPYPELAYPLASQNVAAFASDAYPVPEATSIVSYPSPTVVQPGARAGSPTVRPSPTAAEGRPPARYNGLLVTPLPDEKIQVGPPTLLNNASYLPLETPTSTRHYSIRNEWIGSGAATQLVLFVHDSTTGVETQLGNPEGSAQFGTGNDQYIIWKSGCNGCSVLPTGLYAYSLQTGTETQISTRAIGNGYPRLEGSWVVYADRAKDEPMWLTLDLHAHNLLTGADILVSSDVVNAFQAGVGGFVNDFYLLQGGRVAWITWTGISTYDLTQHTQRILTAPRPERAPRHWTISGDIMLWQDEFYQGYDLKRDAYFSIPIIPPGWEDKVIENVGQVKAEGDNIFWSLETGGRTYYFSAPLIAKGSADTISGQATPAPAPGLFSTLAPLLVHTASP